MRAKSLPLWLSALLCAGCGGGDAAQPAATLAPLAASAAVASRGPPNFVDEVLTQANEQRAQGADCGSAGRFQPAPPLAWSDALAAAAQAHSEDMAARDYFAHVSPDGVELGDRADAAGYRWNMLAENIAAGPGSIDAVIAGWVGSDRHCANLMNPALRDVGMACVAGGNASYRSDWTMDLGRPR